jgi:hypothetical protein
LPDDQSGIFLREGLDRLLGDLPVGLLRVATSSCAQAHFNRKRRENHNWSLGEESALTSKTDIGSAACQVRKVTPRDITRLA